MNDFSPESIYSPDMTPEELIRYRTLHGNPWKILTLEEVRESESLSKNFTNQSDATILAGIEVVTRFPGFHKFLVGTGEYGGPDFDTPGMCIYMDMPSYIKHCYETNQLDEIGNLFNYIKDKLIINQNDTSYNNLRFSFSDSPAFDDIEFRKRFLMDMKDSDLKKYLIKRFDAIYGNL